MAQFSREELIDAFRHVFIIADDSGINERIVPPPHLRRPPGIVPYSKRTGEVDINGDSDEDGNAQWYTDLHKRHSVPIEAEFEVGRGRSHTALQIEQIREERAKSVKAVQLRDMVEQQTLPLEEIRPKRKPMTHAERMKTLSSMASQIIEAHSMDSHSDSIGPFDEYARFEAESSQADHVKVYSIYLTMCLPPTAMTVMVSMQHEPRISDLIGLACLKYERTGHVPALTHTTPAEYKLYMCDDDEIEYDLPPMRHSEYLARIGFTQLALVAAPVARSVSNSPSTSEYKVTVYYNIIDELVTVDLPIDSTTTIAMLRKRALEHLSVVRPLSSEAITRHLDDYSVQYLEETSMHGDPEHSNLDLDMLVHDCGMHAFVVLRTRSNRWQFDMMRKNRAMLPSSPRPTSQLSVVRDERAASNASSSGASSNYTNNKSFDLTQRKGTSVSGTNYKPAVYSVELTEKTSYKKAELNIFHDHLLLMRYHHGATTSDPPERRRLVRQNTARKSTISISAIGGCSQSDDGIVRISYAKSYNADWIVLVIQPQSIADAHEICDMLDLLLDKRDSNLRGRWKEEMRRRTDALFDGFRKPSLDISVAAQISKPAKIASRLFRRSQGFVSQGSLAHQASLSSTPAKIKSLWRKKTTAFSSDLIDR